MMAFRCSMACASNLKAVFLQTWIFPNVWDASQSITFSLIHLHLQIHVHVKRGTTLKMLMGLLYVWVNVAIKSLHHRMSNVMTETFEMEMAAIETANFNPISLALSLSQVNALYSLMSPNSSTITHTWSKARTDANFHFQLPPLIQSSLWLIGRCTWVSISQPISSS